jgi:hypothetical protein
MLCLIGNIVVVLFPTWAIERELRKQRATLDGAEGSG